MSVIFADRLPEPFEIERFRLIFSTYQDGSGMLIPGSMRSWMNQNNVKSIPGWRDFERAVALAFDGRALESKYIYDVLLPDLDDPSISVGVSCKMRKELRAVERSGRVNIELSNAAGEFWDTIKRETQLNENTYSSDPALIGAVLVSTVERWHEAIGVDNSRSFFLTLQWDEPTGYYQLFQFPIDLPSASTLMWSVAGRRLIGRDGAGVLFEWYGFSGGQLKYYPPIAQARWISDRFTLEPLPNDLDDVLLNKAATYFPGSWQKVVQKLG
jgi:hypothetical protein